MPLVFPQITTQHHEKQIQVTANIGPTVECGSYVLSLLDPNLVNVVPCVSLYESRGRAELDADFSPTGDDDVFGGLTRAARCIIQRKRRRSCNREEAACCSAPNIAVCSSISPRTEKDIFTASDSNMKNDVGKASAPIRGKGIDVASASNNENGGCVINVSNEGKDTATELLERLQNKMKLLSSKQDWAKYCCIYTVPHSLRNMKPEAYTPQLISIGPLHHSDERLKAMEEHKLRYLEVFIEQNEMDETRIMDLLSSIHKDEEYIRLCYPHRLEEIKSSDLVEMIVLDAVFIIEFFKKLTAEFFNDSTADRPRMFFDPRMTFCILEDLMLLENQLPFFVIEQIFKKFNLDRQDIEYIDGNGITFLDLAAFHFRKLTFTQGAEYEQQILVMNFTDLLRNFMLKGALERSNSTESIKLKYSAIMLRKAGIKFKVSRDNCLINIQFENGVLKIPRLEVHDSFERFVRNLMALEQYYNPYEAYICNYFKFMDHLINTAEDVDLLIQEGIILNCLGDSESVSNLINNLCHQTSETYSCYSDICQKMNEHYENRWNHRRATLKLVYFSNVWRGTGIVAAAILLILTLIQTIISVKSLF